jgi:CBS domain-containing protein
MTTDPATVSVADLMTDELVTCRPGATLSEVAVLLAQHRIHAVFVLDADGRPAGVVSDFDLLAGEWLGDDADGLQTMRTMTAAELMTSPVEAIASTARAAEAAARLADLHLSRLLVTDDHGAAAGVISVSDLVGPLSAAPAQRSTVRDVMSYAMVTCLGSTPLHAAARAMSERRSRSIVVVDDLGRAAGVVSGHDLLSLYRARNGTSTVEDLMRAPITVGPDLPLPEAANLMLRHEIHRLVVVDPGVGHGAPIGIISTSDIVAEMAQSRSVWQAVTQPDVRT